MIQYKLIGKELLRHAPFTLFGAFSGILIMILIVVANIPAGISTTTFYILHPTHILLSALVTTGIYRRHEGKGWGAFLIGYFGSIGICTLSDIIFPYIGGVLIGAKIELHIGFIEKWWLVNPLACAGIALGYWRPTTKFPHLGHVLLSTWASLFYLTAFGIAIWLILLPPLFLILFISVWFPCCLSDIIFPMLFVREDR